MNGEEQPALGVMVTRCKRGFILSSESRPPLTDYYTASSLDEVKEVLAVLFHLTEK